MHNNKLTISSIVNIKYLQQGYRKYYDLRLHA